MHVHPAAVSLHPINTCAAGNERAAAQRAAEVRKRLLKSAAGIEAVPDSDLGATLLAGQWLDTRHSQVLPEDEYRPAAAGNDPYLG